MRRFFGETLFYVLFLGAVLFVLTLAHELLQFADLLTKSRMDRTYSNWGKLLVSNVLGVLLALPAFHDKWKEPGEWSIHRSTFWFLFFPAFLMQLYLWFVASYQVPLFFQLAWIEEPFITAIPLFTGAMLVQSFTKRS